MIFASCAMSHDVCIPQLIDTKLDFWEQHAVEFQCDDVNICRTG